MLTVVGSHLPVEELGVKSNKIQEPIRLPKVAFHSTKIVWRLMNRYTFRSVRHNMDGQVCAPNRVGHANYWSVCVTYSSIF